MGKSKKAKHLEVLTPEMIQETEKTMVEGVDQLIDMEVTEFCRYVENRNVGELRSIRLYLENRMLELNTLCDTALRPASFVLSEGVTRDRVVQLISMFVNLAKIDAKRGIIDHSILSKEVKPLK
ncbi:hypothetical protein D1872_178460 [compost metagenome]